MQLMHQKIKKIQQAISKVSRTSNYSLLELLLGPPLLPCSSHQAYDWALPFWSCTNRGI
ncbi:hypothetical protein PanWU01x14_201410 [Parasponia andersonii]|uniref:Uncharacterized protein n=1 Tax=Parasponia andersonii TaxID=3476 RepID=A0A2P5BXQ4_PARAD|nr:hypothetical protein PanWU01x14_201410 [Parasponia andersonii]